MTFTGVRRRLCNYSCRLAQATTEPQHALSCGPKASLLEFDAKQVILEDFRDARKDGLHRQSEEVGALGHVLLAKVVVYTFTGARIALQPSPQRERESERVRQRERERDRHKVRQRHSHAPRARARLYVDRRRAMSLVAAGLVMLCTGAQGPKPYLQSQRPRIFAPFFGKYVKTY